MTQDEPRRFPPSAAEIRHVHGGEYRSVEVRRRFDRRFPRGTAPTKTAATAEILSTTEINPERES